jgi:prophage DNA circulation protein
VHPSIGSRTVSVVEFSATERAAKGRAVDLEFTFVQTVGPLFPSTIVQTQSGVLNAGAAAQIAVAADFAAATLGALQYGAGVAVQAAGTVALWVAIAGQLAGDAGALAGAVAGLPGNNGRYSGGALATLLGAGATVQTVIAGAITKKTATLAAGAAVQAAGADLGVSTAATFAAAVQALAEAVRAGANNPADQVRILVVLQNFTPVIQPGEGIGAAIATAQAATAALCRLSALISLAYACAAYQPTSSNDAQSLMALATGFLDAAITVAGDAEQDATYQAMRALRTAVVMDLTVRGANLPALITVTSNEPQPALTLAYRLYLDATRADDLVTRANPVAPMFMPLSFLALSS